MLYGTHAASLQNAAPTYEELVASSNGAWSLKLINTAYSGSCVRVVRSSDSAESDFGFVGTNLFDNVDAASILSWLAGSTGYVKTWYDQSGNGLNLSNTSTSVMPLIAAGGSMYSGESGEYMLYTNGGSRKLTTSTVSWIVGVPYSFSSVVQFGGLAASNQYIGTYYTTSNGYRLQIGIYYAGNKYGIGQWNNDYVGPTNVTTANTTIVHSNKKINTGGCKIWENGTLYGSSTSQPNSTHLLSGLTEFSIFAGAGTNYFDSGGYIGEVIAFGSELSDADMETLWTEQITQWNV